jgi:threonyl-tRNA synthetase
MDDYRVRIGLRDPDSTKYTGESELWNKAENALREAVKTLDVEYKEEPGEAAFYGPKIDFVVRDVIGREWQLGTVQVDYNLPIRFDLSYTGSDNKPHRPVMIHRAPFGSMERFVGLLIEHFSGNFPTWLAPEQVRVLPMNLSLNEYANQVLKKLRAHGIRAKIDTSGDKLGAMIRNAELDKTPHMLVIGNKEAEGKLVSARSRLSNEFQGSMDVDRAIEILSLEIQSRSLPNKQ